MALKTSPSTTSQPGARLRARVLFASAALALIAVGSSAASRSQHGKDVDWPVYGGNAAGQRYSALAQITPGNVSRLAQAWRFESGPGGLQTSPIVIGRTLYGYAADQSVIALDAATGEQRWRFSSGNASFQPARGVTYWRQGAEQRLFVSSSHFLYALDPENGQPIAAFGRNGRIDLRDGLGGDPEKHAVFLTSPGIVHDDVLITGFRTGEDTPAALGTIRAFDVRTGRLRWRFHTIPQDADPGAATWPKDARKSAGGANNWAGMALDEARGIVYVPTGSAVPDFYGAERHGDDLYANSLLALDARTGRRLWHFQVVHHDIWDRDLPAPPTLLTVTRGGRRIDAVAQASKQGLLFVFDRVSGQALFPIVERPVPPSDVPGEQAAPTQPFPTLPAPLARQVLTEDLLTRRTPEAHAAAVARFRTVRSDGPYTPLGVGRKTVIFPGFDGGAEWGGAAADPARGILYINVQDIPSLGSLMPNAANAAASGGERLYLEQCASCHGPERQGVPPEFPSLLAVHERLSRQQLDALIVGGKGRMPGFPQLAAAERQALADFLLTPKTEGGFTPPPNMTPAMIAEFRKLGGDRRTRYLFTGYEKFRDPDGYPAVVPPWGTLNAIDLNSGKYLWRRPLGEYPELVAAGLRDTGSENYGGPLLTATRLLFVGATIYDRKFRAFDARDGRLLWETSLPYAGVATPITYAVDGRQYVVIAASGARDPKGPQGSAYVAFALP